jgi:hypothetical protein
VGFFLGMNISSECFLMAKWMKKFYQEWVLSTFSHRFSYFEYKSLWSTSPAYAILNFEQKIEAWKVIKVYMVK